jgi:phosphoribosylformylglycinamidine cyclo-ligase
MTDSLTYAASGVDINKADKLKEGLKTTLKSEDSRILTKIGDFAALFSIAGIEGISEPVLCLKMEEPGSKQLLAAQENRLPEIGIDLVNHLINDTIMNGGKPLAILDTIVCGELEPEKVSQLISKMADAARVEGCALVGGETSEQS